MEKKIKKLSDYTKLEVKKMIEDIYNNIPKTGQTYKLYCFSEQCMEDFNKAFKEEVERLYGKENNNE